MGESWEHTIAAGTFTLKSGGGTLYNVVVNTTANGTITLYDSVTATGRKIAVLKASVAENTYKYKLRFTNGLTMVTGAASDVTVTFT